MKCQYCGLGIDNFVTNKTGLLVSWNYSGVCVKCDRLTLEHPWYVKALHWYNLKRWNIPGYRVYSKIKVRIYYSLEWQLKKLRRKLTKRKHDERRFNSS